MSDRLRRLLLLVPAVRARQGIHIRELAEMLACTEKELRKDVDLLACVGAPPFLPDDLIDIELRDDDRVYVALPLGFDRPTRLLATEAAALVIASRALAPNDPIARSATEKLSRAVAPAQRQFYDALLKRFATTESEDLDEIDATIRKAIAEQRELEIVYFSSSTQSTAPRIVRPRAIAMHNGLRYLSAQRTDGTERTYRIDRIAHAKVLDTRFDPLPLLDLEAVMEQVASFDQHPDLPRATIRFDSSVAASAKARHPNAREVEGGAEVEIPYSTLPWLVSYTLSWGGTAEIVAPAEARSALESAVQKAIEAHRA
jgi:proteasome accessory factor C